jgi:glycosyltransferase involved in cell wall biosynthesis
MRIGIDARGAMKVTDGIGRYATELLKEFARRKDAHEYFVLKNPVTRVSFAYDNRFKEVVVEEGRFSLQEQVALPGILNRLHLDVFHALHFCLPVGYRGPSVMSVHDILPLINPWSFGRSALRNAVSATYLSGLIRMSIRRASVVIVSSENTRQDMITHLGTDPQRMQMVYLGIDHLAAAPEAASDSLLAQLGIRRPFLLTVTNFKPHKNTGALIEAFRMARPALPDLHLGIVGDNPRGFAEEYGSKEELAAEGIHILGYLDDATIAGLMAASIAFVYPSLYEGFGFPVLEGMAAGVPVISSSAASLPELGGDAVMYVDPHAPEQMASAIRKLCSDEDLRRDYAARGRVQATHFPWSATADTTMDIYTRVAGRRIETRQ